MDFIEVSIPSSIRSSSEPGQTLTSQSILQSLNPFINQVIFRTQLSTFNATNLKSLNPFINQVIFRTPSVLFDGNSCTLSQSLHQSGHLPNKRKRTSTVVYLIKSQSLHQSGHLPNSINFLLLDYYLLLSQSLHQSGHLPNRANLSGAILFEASQSLHQSGHLPNFCFFGSIRSRLIVSIPSSIRSSSERQNGRPTIFRRWNRLNPFINQVIFRTTGDISSRAPGAASQSLHQSGHLPNRGNNSGNKERSRVSIPSSIRSSSERIWKIWTKEN